MMPRSINMRSLSTAIDGESPCIIHKPTRQTLVLTGFMKMLAGGEIKTLLTLFSVGIVRALKRIAPPGGVCTCV